MIPVALFCFRLLKEPLRGVFLGKATKKHSIRYPWILGKVKGIKVSGDYQQRNDIKDSMLKKPVPHN
jgi:hypothetical protein